MRRDIDEPRGTRRPIDEIYAIDSDLSGGMAVSDRELTPSLGCSVKTWNRFCPARMVLTVAH